MSQTAQISENALISNNYSLVEEGKIFDVFGKYIKGKYSIEFLYNKLDRDWKAKLALNTKFGPVNIDSLDIISEIKLNSSILSVEEAIEYFWSTMN